MSTRRVGEKVFVVSDNIGQNATIIDARESTSTPSSHCRVRTEDGQEFWAFDHEINDADSTGDTRAHILKVRDRIDTIVHALQDRAEAHDASKLTEPERSGYDRLVTRLSDVEYGTAEYRAALDEARPIIEHHYKHNSHHPEHWPNGINDMSLIDIIEMLCDWKAASERTKQCSIRQSLEHNKQRFGIDDQLYAIMVHTVERLGW